MYIVRDIEPVIKRGAAQSPVIAIIGPRQSGKSTLAKEIFKTHRYVDMQDADSLEFANSDPKGFLESYGNEQGIIIDEAQYAPKLFAQIKVEVDKDSRPGYYVLSGSQNFLLHEAISESLAGRVYFYTLLPLSIKELTSANLQIDNVPAQMVKGFYPRVYQSHIDGREYYENYILTYVERDIRTIRNIDNMLLFRKFMQLCALRIGTTLNYADLATSCGISINTVKSWLALLEMSFIIFELPSYHDNLGKRITKSPKIYFYDVGLAIALMGLTQQIVTHKRELYGGLFENMVIVDLVKNIYAHNKRPMLTFFRDSNKNEIDLIIEFEGQTIPVEIKAAQTMDNRFFDTARWFKEQIKSDAEPLIIYGGQHTQKRSHGNVLSWQQIDRVLF